jgi:O-antigen/teichoic acid export membrane protein
VDLAHVSSKHGMAGRVAHGAAWSAAGRVANRGIQFTASLVLARLLDPRDFGLFATVAVFTQFAQIFFELGMGASLVQLRDLREEDLSTVFWINALGGVVFAGLMAGVGPFIADFFGEPRLSALTPLVAVSFTVNLGVCHLALLQRSMRFKAIAKSEIASAVVGVAVSLGLATAGAGVVSLALGPAAQSLAMSVLVWRLVPWRPHRFIVGSSVRRIWRFTGGLLGFNVLNYWGRNADNLLIGRFVGATALGYYSRAFNLMAMQVQETGQVVGRVLLPTLASMQHDPVRVAGAYRRTVRLMNLVTVPALVGVAAVSPALVPLLWGDKWQPMVPILSVICLAGVPQSLTTSAGWIFQSQGRTGQMFRNASISSGLGIAAMAYGVQWGALGVAWAVLARSWLFLPLPLFFACRLIKLSPWRLACDSLSQVLTAAIMGAGVWLLPPASGLDRSAGSTLLLQVTLGVLLYAVSALVFQRETLREAVSILRKKGQVAA